MSTGNYSLWQRAPYNAQQEVQAYTSFKFMATRLKKEYNNLSCITAIFTVWIKVFIFTCFLGIIPKKIL